MVFAFIGVAINAVAVVATTAAAAATVVVWVVAAAFVADESIILKPMD